MAVQHAFKILGWHENLVSEEIPPEWMWVFDDELKLWFEDVEARRAERYGGGSNRDVDVPTVSNELVRGRK